MDYPGKVISKNAVVPSQTSASGVWTLDDAAAAVESNTWPIAGVPNPISRSLRFNSADSAYLNRTPATAGNRRTFTWSGWVKRCNPNTTNTMFAADVDATNFFAIWFREEGDNGRFEVLNYSTTYDFRIETTQVFRDVSAWYHVVVAIDTTQATSTNRVKIYINGSQVTALSTTTYPSQNFDTDVNTTNSHKIGVQGSSYGLHNGYLTEINFIDGQALTPSDFGMTDPQTGAWIPKAYTGTYGTNGFYLNFSDNASTAALGTDYSGNNNTWTTNNFSVTAGISDDSLTDVPTPWIPYNTTGDVGGVVRGNYATLNPLSPINGGIFTNGNLQFTSFTIGNAAIATIGMSSGKWYWEARTQQGSTEAQAGVYGTSASSLYSFAANATDYGFRFDADAGTLDYTTDGVSFTSLDTGLLSGPYFPYLKNNGTTNKNMFINFGQRPFAYTPPAGFLSLCTTNLPTPTILDGGEYFNTVLWTGTGSGTTRAITGVGFQPDWVWAKVRSAAYSHSLYDVIRGGGANAELQSDSTAAEGGGNQDQYGYLSSFDSDGFTSTAGTQGAANNLYFNQSGTTYVAWNWKANGTPAVTNTDGTITSSISVNTTSGFSIVTYTGTGSAATVGHGLGVAPSFIIIKNRTDASNWAIYHASVGNTTALLFDTSTGSTLSAYWNNTSPTSSVYTVGTANITNGSSDSMVAYCFAAIPGYSAFGSYTGNGSADGPFVYTGFRPALIIRKRTDNIGDWIMMDDKRNTYNLTDNRLLANSSNAEVNNGNNIDILSNGWKERNADGYSNASGGTYIYMAFATNPFKYSNAR